MRVIGFIAAGLLCASSLPASAKMMGCTGENMTKTSAAILSMPDSPNKWAMNKEMGNANTEMSKGNMRKACTHYMKAQKAAAAKSSGGMKM